MEHGDQIITWTSAFLGALVANIAGIRELRTEIKRLRRWCEAIGDKLGVPEPPHRTDP